MPLQKNLLSLGILLSMAVACTSPQRQAPTSVLITPEVSGDQGPTGWHEARQTVADVAREAPNPDQFDSLLSSIGELSRSPLYKESRVELLIDGPATFREMFQAIEQAQHSIYLETYIFADDEAGQQFAARLMEKARQGIDVRLIYDSIGSLSSGDGFFERMEEAGVKSIEYHAINPLDGGNPLDANTRDHRKILVVDDAVAFTGGINLSRTYSSGSSHSPSRASLDYGWRDTHIAIYGPAIDGFRQIFMQQWHWQGGKPENMPHVDVPIARAGNDLVAVLQSEGGNDQESAIYRAYLDAMDIAVTNIWITQAYFAPDDAFMTTLKAAAQRGVDVRIVVPGVSDSQLVLHASRSRYGELLRAGVKIYENTSSVLHAKTAVIDGIWSTVGSSNLDYRSFIHNDEVNAVVLGTAFGRQMEAQFEQDIERGRPIKLEEWEQRSITDRVREFFSWSVEYWL
tara:strand:+ start:126471 stop:127841 length:1371 start_codon:yes stop_codon:yes gene_type:complete